MDEDHPCERTNGTDHVGGLGTDNDAVSIGPRLRAGHAASFGFARSAFVERSRAARGTTIRRLPEPDTRQPGAGSEELAGEAVGKRSADAEHRCGLIDRQERSVAGRRLDWDGSGHEGLHGLVRLRGAERCFVSRYIHIRQHDWLCGRDFSETPKRARGSTPMPFAPKPARAQQTPQPPAPAGGWRPLPLTAASESRRNSRSVARKNGLDVDTRISHADRSPAYRPGVCG